MTLLFLAGFLALFLPAVQAESPDPRLYEMRIYYAAPGKLEALHARFRDHTVKLFEKHGMANLGYWMPLTNAEQKLIYILSYPNRAAREASWKAFMADPEWQAAYKASEVNGRLVSKAEVVFLTPTDYSPPIQPKADAKPRCFELRTYAASPGKLEALNARFRDHTVKLFAKHGMTQIGYWTPIDKNKGANHTLIYLLAHQSPEAAAASFKTFRTDPAWLEAKQASEVNGPLASKVESLFMAPTDYSPLK